MSAVGRLLGHDATEITLAAAGQSLSGLLNVVLAELLAGLPGPIQRLRSQAGLRDPKPLRTQLFHQLVPLAAIPLALLGLGLGGLFARAAERGANAELAERIRLVGHRVGDIVAEQEAALRALSGRLAERPRPPLAARAALALVQEQRLRPRFTSLLLTDPAGRVLASAGEVARRRRRRAGDPRGTPRPAPGLPRPARTVVSSRSWPRRCAAAGRSSPASSSIRGSGTIR